MGAITNSCPSFIALLVIAGLTHVNDTLMIALLCFGENMLLQIFECARAPTDVDTLYAGDGKFAGAPTGSTDSSPRIRSLYGEHVNTGSSTFGRPERHTILNLEVCGSVASDRMVPIKTYTRWPSKQNSDNSKDARTASDLEDSLAPLS